MQGQPVRPVQVGGSTGSEPEKEETEEEENGSEGEEINPFKWWNFNQEEGNKKVKGTTEGTKENDEDPEVAILAQK